MQAHAIHPDVSQATGAPRFARPDLNSLHLNSGAMAAWRQAYATLGAQAAASVGGDFAVTLETAAGGTYLAVDRFAIHTLCYRIQGGRLRFASRADDLADNGDGTRAEIDPQAIYDYLFFHVVPSPRTVFKGIYRLPPGHFALFKDNKLAI